MQTCSVALLVFWNVINQYVQIQTSEAIIVALGTRPLGLYGRGGLRGESVPPAELRFEAKYHREGEELDTRKAFNDCSIKGGFLSRRLYHNDAAQGLCGILGSQCRYRKYIMDCLDSS